MVDEKLVPTDELSVEDDVEGHKKFTPDEPADDDVEGHKKLIPDDDDVEGHKR